MYKLSETTDSSGRITAYIEYYGMPDITVYAEYQGNAVEKTIETSGALYKNSFLMTIYNFPLRSNFSSWDDFESSVQINGTGYDDTNNQWYRYNLSGSIIPISGPNSTSSGTTPTVRRSIAVDEKYITRENYVSDGSTSSTYHRGYVFIEGLNNVSGDNGYRYAEDAGGSIKGYHIDLFVGFDTLPQFYSNYAAHVAQSAGYYFPKITYVSTQKGDI